MSQDEYNQEDENFEEEDTQISEDESDDSVEDEEDNSDSEESLEAESDDSEEDIDWKERALKAEKAIERNKQKTKKKPQSTLKKRPTEDDDDVAERIARLEQSDQKRAFGYEHGLSPQATDELFAYAKGVGKKPETVMKTAIGKSIINTVKRKERLDGNSPSSSAKKSSFASKDFNSLSPQDKQKAFEQFVKRTMK